MKQLLFFLSFIILVSFVGAQINTQQQKHSPLIGPYKKSDTTKPKYRYIYRLPEIGAEMFERIMYVTDSIMYHWGQEKGTTESNNAKLLYFNYSNYLKRVVVFDSVKIDQPKGGGKP